MHERETNGRRETRGKPRGAARPIFNKMIRGMMVMTTTDDDDDDDDDDNDDDDDSLTHVPRHPKSRRSPKRCRADSR